MVQITKKENESSGSLLRRFSRAIKLSKTLNRARSHRYYEAPQSEFQKRKDAIRKVGWQKEMEKQRKLGKIN